MQRDVSRGRLPGPDATRWPSSGSTAQAIGRTDEIIKRIGSENRRIGHGGAGGREDTGDVRGRQPRDSGAIFLAAQPLPAADQSGSEQRAQHDAHAGAD